MESPLKQPWSPGGTPQFSRTFLLLKQAITPAAMPASAIIERDGKYRLARGGWNARDLQTRFHQEQRRRWRTRRWHRKPRRTERWRTKLQSRFNGLRYRRQFRGQNS